MLTFDMQLEECLQPKYRGLQVGGGSPAVLQSCSTCGSAHQITSWAASRRSLLSPVLTPAVPNLDSKCVAACIAPRLHSCCSLGMRQCC